MSKLEKLKDRAKGLEARDPRAAIDAWQEVLRAQDEEGDPNPDLSIFNRIGDLHLKLRDPAQAADAYDRAVDQYAELGFYNNAIAMCNKVLRNAPGRPTAYLKLAKLYAAKGFVGEATQNFVEYADRMQKAGRLDQAFAALKELTDMSPANERLRDMLEEHLRMYGGEVPARKPGARPPPPAEADDVTKSGKRKASSLVFLDLDEPPARKGGAPAKGPPAPPPAPSPAPAPPPLVTMEESQVAEPDTSLEIERTALVEDDLAAGGTTLDGLELTHADFGSVKSSAGEPPSLREEPKPPADEPALADFEPTVVDDEPPPPPRPAPAPKAAPRVAFRPKAAPPAAPQHPPKRKTVVEIPPLELETDFESAMGKAAPEADDAPLRSDEAGVRGFVETEDDTSVSGGSPSRHVDLGLEGVVNQGDVMGSLVFDATEMAPARPSIAELEARVADDPDDADAHQTLGEALIEGGQRERGIEELDLATAGFEARGNLSHAQSLVEEILRLDPNSVRHRQKQVEFAFKTGDKARLVDAYLELADSLLRNDLPEKARSVYERVVEHDRSNARARSALAMLAPPVAEPEGRVKAKDAKMRVRDETAVDGDFIDLGAMVLGEPGGPRDTRMVVEDEEPTGDEEQDFQEMLARFKQGIDENIDEADFQSHYDLGVAFKEMGLLDEAIAEFQKALRAPEGKLRTSEALGVCFFEKGAYSVAESILRRGLELPATGDQERLGILYWLARCLEEQGTRAEAKTLYGRVFAVDIRFKDVGDRVKALTKAK